MDTPFYVQPAVGWRMYGLYLLFGDDSALTGWANKWFYWSIIGEKVKGMRYVGDEAVCAPGNPLLEPSDPDFKNPHEVPALNHGCGFYAYHKLERLSAVGMPGHATRLDDVIHNPIGHLRPFGRAPAAVLALVQGYGRVIAHNTTYRAQKMRIAALCSDGKHTRELVEAHADNLGIPALSRKEMEEYAEYAGVCLA